MKTIAKIALAASLFAGAALASTMPAAAQGYYGYGQNSYGTYGYSQQNRAMYGQRDIRNYDSNRSWSFQRRHEGDNRAYGDRHDHRDSYAMNRHRDERMYRNYYRG